MTKPSFRPRYELCLLDFDGTLADASPGIVWRMLRACELFAISPPASERVKECIGLPLEQMLLRLIPGLPVQDLSTWITIYREQHKADGAPPAQLYAGVLETLLAARRAGVGIVVVSNKGEPALRASVETLGLAPLVHAVLGDLRTPSGQAPRKPDPALYEQRVRPLFPAVPVERILTVGDAPVDLEFGQAIGADSCYASYGFGDSQACLSCRPTHVISCFSELTSVLGFPDSAC